MLTQREMDTCPETGRVDLSAAGETGETDPVTSAAGWRYRVEQVNGDHVDCWGCGVHIDDDVHVMTNDAHGFVYHSIDCFYS